MASDRVGFDCLGAIVIHCACCARSVNDCRFYHEVEALALTAIGRASYAAATAPRSPLSREPFKACNACEAIQLAAETLRITTHEV